MELFELKGKKAIVTGASRGLGLGAAEGLLEAGAEVVLIGSSVEVLKKAQEYQSRGYQVYGVQADLSDPQQLAEAFEKSLQLLSGRLDILVQAAGVQRRHRAEEFPFADWEYVLQVNLNAVFQLSQLAGQVMIKQKSGKIIHFASMLTYFGGLTVPAYAASKGGVAQLTKALSNEWAKYGIQVNAIAPGYMETSMNTGILQDEARNAAITARIPAGRWGTPEDIKGVTVFLASRGSDYLSGAVIPVDGGYLGY